MYHAYMLDESIIFCITSIYNVATNLPCNSASNNDSIGRHTFWVWLVRLEQDYGDLSYSYISKWEFTISLQYEGWWYNEYYRWWHFQIQYKNANHELRHVTISLSSATVHSADTRYTYIHVNNRIWNGTTSNHMLLTPSANTVDDLE
jgi:hypothetical protein